MRKITFLFTVICVSFLSILFLVSPTHAQAGYASLLLTTSTPQVTTGQTVVANITVNSNGQPINTVQVVLTYPPDAFEVTNTDYTNSALSIEAENTTDPGIVRIIRGDVNPASGTLEVGKITFKALKNTPTNVITVSNDSAVFGSTDSTNILTNSSFVSSPVSTDTNVVFSTPSGQPNAENSGRSFLGAIRQFFSELWERLKF